MKAIFFVLFFCVLQASINCWTGIVKYNATITPRNAYCFTESNSIGALRRGEEKRISGLCAIAVCLNNRDISLLGCGVVQVEPPCYVADGDLSKPYPDCCFEIICPQDND
ncbi:hypothetical protein NQ318_011958 [Aromia moschata]|uniref:Single domain-containing protein n=1 Tax=Aromia moschata TaxID=1265417 RepID=A0AAV8XYH4_9CUCU|nr:hypothetical protein NQ318_011958 [Aromia moschata]